MAEAEPRQSTRPPPEPEPIPASWFHRIATLDLGAAWAQGLEFVRHGLWEEPRGKTLPSRALALLQWCFMVGEGFVRDKLLLRATALSYFTVLSLIPVIAVAGSIVGALGIQQTNFIELIVDQLAAVVPQAQTWILEQINNINFGALGTVGAASLFVVTVLAIGNIESAMNEIWGVKEPRTWSRRFPDYLAVLIVAPLLLGTAVSVGASLRSQWILQRLLEYPLFEAFWDVGLAHMPTFILMVGLSFLYWFLPNTSVRVVSALLGGFVAALFVTLAQGFYITFQVGFARSSVLFGTLAALPLLFAWIYVFWAVVLFGAEVAFAHQNLKHYRREVRGLRAGPAELEALGMRIALEIGRAFRDRQPAFDADALSDRLRAPVRSVREVLAELEEAGIIAGRNGDAKGEAYQLGRPAERIAVTEIYDALRGPRVLADPSPSPVTSAVENVMREVDEGGARGAGGRSLDDLLEALPAADAAAA